MTFKVKPIVLSVCTAVAISGCASLQQLSDKAAHVFGQRTPGQTELSADDWYRRGREYQAQQDYDAAVAAYLEALQRDHALGDAHNALGVTYAQQGRYDEAIAELKQAIELKPGYAYIHNNLGYTLLLQGANREAVSALEIAVQLDPDNEKAAFNLRIAHERLGDLQQPSKAAGSAAPKPADSLAARKVMTGRASDPRLMEIGPSIYELKLPMRAEPEIAALPPAVAEESVLPPQQTSPAPRFRLEVSNGNGMPGLAKKVARMLDRSGMHANRITNHATFREATTQIQYRPGYLAEASALHDVFPAQMRVVSGSSLRGDIQVRVLLGKDASRVAKASHQSYAFAPPTESSLSHEQMMR